MEKNKESDRLNSMYLKLNTGDRKIIIRLAEGLLNSQNIIEDENIKSSDRNEKTE